MSKFLSEDHKDLTFANCSMESRGAVKIAPGGGGGEMGCSGGVPFFGCFSPFLSLAAKSEHGGVFVMQ